MSAEHCYRCGTVAPYPVVARLIDAASGAGATLFACLTCACLDYSEHWRHCVTCRTGGQPCETSRTMRRRIMHARRERLIADTDRWLSGQGGQDVATAND